MLRVTLERGARWVWVGLGLGLLAVAALVPNTGVAGVASLVLVGAVGAAVPGVAALRRGKLPRWVGDVVILVVVSVAAWLLFRSSWSRSVYRLRDWAPHHAILKHLVDALREGHVPHWVQSVSTGDSPYELYAFLPYYLAAKAAIWTDATDLTLVLMRSAILTHWLAAAGAGLLTRRAVPWPWGVLVGLATLYDSGSVWGGGVEGVFAMGVVHSALAQAVWSFALIAVLAALERPRLATSACIWGLVALAVACHPLATIAALSTVVALLLVSLLARDVPPWRPLFALLHVAVGVALVAFVWVPFGERLLLYGVHYGIAPKVAWAQFGHMLAHPVPEATVAALVYAGYLGVLVGALSGRAAPMLLACSAAVVLAGMFDQLYVLLDLAPSLQSAGFQMVRLASLAKVPLYICATYLVHTALQQIRWQPGALQRRALGALLALATVGVLRGAVPYFDQLAIDLRVLMFDTVPDPAGLAELTSWAREQNAQMRPDRFGRLLDEDERRTFLVYHVNAESGLPALWVGPALALLFARERIEDTSPASLRRFNVRWVMRADRPPRLGDATTQRRFGRYFVRELPEWDGRFARVERGEGEAVVTTLDDERVEVELRGTSEPALVALGTGYYPRWRAEHEVRGALPVYAQPSFDGAALHVPAAWLPPGRTLFRADGPLPSDGRGRWLSALAALGALASVVVWLRLPRARARLLRTLARGGRALGRRRRELGLGAAVALVLGSAGAAVLAARRPATALQLGNGLFSSGARVRARVGDRAWRSCGYSPLQGGYRCPGPVLVEDTLANLLNDASPNLEYTLPVIDISPSPEPFELEVRSTARFAGEYWAGTRGAEVSLTVGGDLDTTLSEAQSAHVFERSESPRPFTLSASIPPHTQVQIAFVRRDKLDPERELPQAPEQSPFR